jgi:hypothetical protein
MEGGCGLELTLPAPDEGALARERLVAAAPGPALAVLSPMPQERSTA